jgi:hypothetical protein
MLAAVSAAIVAACGRSSTAPSPAPAPPTETRSVTMDFEALPAPTPPTDGMVWYGCSYVEDGFALETRGGTCVSNGFISVHMPPNPVTQYSVDRFIGSVSLANGNWDAMTRLTRSGGGGFTLVSIDLDTFNPRIAGGPSDPMDPQTVTFVGTRLDGATVRQVFTTDRVFPRGETFAFGADFADLAQVEWRQAGPPFHQFDNIVVSARQ